MAPLTNSFEGGTNGSTISTSNSGGASGTAFGAVTIDGGESLTFDTSTAAHGSVSAQVACPTSGSSYVAWTSGISGTSATVYARAYLRFTGNPSATVNVLRILSAANGIMGTIRVNTGGTIGMLYGSGTLAGTSTGALTANAWFRVEVMVTAGTTTGVMTCRVYWTMDGTTPDETLTISNVNTGSANPTRLRVGVVSNAAASAFNIDDLGLDDAGWIGPAGGGGGVSGTLAATLPHLTAASSIALKDTGTAAATLPHLGAAVQASETDPAAIAATLPKLAAAVGTGTPPDTASFAATLPKLTALTAVAQTDQATAIATLPHLSAQVAAALRNAATAALTLPSLVVDLRSSTPATDGTLAATLPALVISLGEEETISGRVAASLPTLRASLASAASETAVLAGTLPSLRAAVSDAPLVVDELPDLAASIAPTGRLAAAVTVPGHLTATATPSGRLAAVVE